MKYALATAILAFLLLGAGDVATQPKSPAARQAMEKADQTIAAAKAAYDNAVAHARTVEIAELQKAEKLAMQAGNLDEANAISAKVNECQASADDAGKSATVEGLVGRWKVHDTLGVFVWDIEPKSVTHDHAGGNMTVPIRQGSGILIRWGKGGYVERFTPIGNGRVLLESWEPAVANGFPETMPTAFGIGERVK